MPIFYRGAGVRTWWHQNDPRLQGFVPHSPGMLPSFNQLKNHISRGTVTSPYISLTRSYGVAVDYALTGQAKPSRKEPAFVWQVELDDPLPPGLLLIDPVQVIAKELPEPTTQVSYHHDGPQAFLLGVIDPGSFAAHLTNPCPMPPGAPLLKKAPNLTQELQTLVFALRDAEVLAVGTIPAVFVRARYEVF